MTAKTANLAASIHQRLLNLAKARGSDFNGLLGQFANERLLYRVARSPFAERFVLKGALLLLVWLPERGRPTRDLDLLGSGDLSADALREVFRAVCWQSVEGDGVDFHADSVAVRDIRGRDEYGGQRVTLAGNLGAALLRVQVDVGIGDRVTPPPEWIDYPVLLDMPQPHVRAYRPETTIAEKLHAMVILDLQNSRMKDFFDVLRLAETHRFSGEVLVATVRDTFARRRTEAPAGRPTAFTLGFAASPIKATQWKAFRKKSGPLPVEEDLATVTEKLAQFLLPVLDAARQSSSFPMVWLPGGPWVAHTALMSG